MDDLKHWYHQAHPEDDEEVVDPSVLERWNTIVKIIQGCFKGEIPTAFTLGVLVIIPKDDKGGVRGIGLLESIHKLVSQIINIRMTKSIEFCKEVHGFRCKRGTHTAIGDTKLKMQIAGCLSDTVYQIFLDLRKAYDSIARNRVLKLLEKYGVGPNIRRYISDIWDKQFFVLRQAQFYSDPIEVNRGCTQGDVDSPIIFNVIIDAVLRSWKASDGFGRSDACFYADDGLIQHRDPKILQNDLDYMISLFGKVGLRPNATKTKFMVFRGAPTPRAKKREDYNKIRRKRRKAPLVSSTREWRLLRTTCAVCGKEITKASLKRHMETQHSVTTNKYVCREAQDTGSYNIDFHRGKFNNCPVPQCTGGGKEKFGIYRHFCLIHPQADIVINEDVELPKCQKCGMRARDLTKHLDTYTCKRGAARRNHEAKQDQQYQANQVKFYVDGNEIERVRYFKYLGRVLTEDDNDSMCIDANLRKARNQWNSIAKILKREGANSKCMARFYLTVVQAVLLYGADTWSISNRDNNKLRSFHRRAIRYMTGSHIRTVGEDEWEYPDHDVLLKKCGLFSIDIYLQRRRGTLCKYLETYRKDLLEEAEKCGRHCLNVHKVMWWNQAYLQKQDMPSLSNFWTV